MNEASTSRIQSIQNFYTERFKKFGLRRYEAHLKSQNIDEDEFDEYQGIQWKDLDERFISFFDAKLRECSCFYRVPILDFQTLTCRIDFSGNDDGWLLVFDESNHFLTIGQTYLEVTVWADLTLIQQYSDWKSLLIGHWGRGLPGFWDARKISVWARDRNS